MHKDRFKRLMSKMSDADYDEAASPCHNYI